MNIPTVEELQREINSIQTVMEAFARANVSYEHARVLLVNQKHWTMGYATEQLDLWETITKITLEK